MFEKIAAKIFSRRDAVSSDDPAIEARFKALAEQQPRVDATIGDAAKKAGRRPAVAGPASPFRKQERG